MKVIRRRVDNGVLFYFCMVGYYIESVFLKLLDLKKNKDCEMYCIVGC